MPTKGQTIIIKPVEFGRWRIFHVRRRLFFPKKHGIYEVTTVGGEDEPFVLTRKVKE